jgi:hypothetical protein
MIPGKQSENYREESAEIPGDRLAVAGSNAATE